MLRHFALAFPMSLALSLGLAPGLARAANLPPQLKLPEVAAELKAQVAALKKPVHTFAATCFSHPIDRSDSQVPEECSKLEADLRAELAKVDRVVATHALFVHGVLYLVRANESSDEPWDFPWRGSEDNNAKVLAALLADGDAKLISHYAVFAMRMAQDSAGDGSEGMEGDRVLWLSQLIVQATNAPLPPLKGVWNGDIVPAGKLAHHWRAWWAANQANSMEQLRNAGLAQTTAALADADLTVRFWAALGVLTVPNSPARLQAIWAVRGTLLEGKLAKPAREGFDALAMRFPEVELLLPAPLAGQALVVPNPAPPLVVDTVDPLDQPLPPTSLPTVPSAAKADAARLAPLFRKMAKVCWADGLAGDADGWPAKCQKLIDAVAAGEPPPTDTAVFFGALTGLFVPAAEGKLKLPASPLPVTPAAAMQYASNSSSPVDDGVLNRAFAHLVSLMLARPQWTAGEAAIYDDLSMNLPSRELRPPLVEAPWLPKAPDELRRAMVRQVALWQLRNEAAKTKKSQPFRVVSAKLAHSGHLATRFRHVCDDTWVASKADRAESLRLVRQVLLSDTVPLQVRRVFVPPRCQFERHELLVGSPWPAPASAPGGAAVSGVAAPQAAPADAAVAPLSCRQALQGWYSQEAVQACGPMANSNGEPRPDALWAQLDAKADASKIAGLIEPWLPRSQGATLAALREVWAAAATATGQRATVTERLQAWVAADASSPLADRLALLQGKSASSRWWRTAATGAACLAQRGQEVDAAWLARRGWVASVAEFARARNALGPVLRQEVAQRVAQYCPAQLPAAAPGP